MHKGIEGIVTRGINVVNLNAIRVDFITLLESIPRRYFLRNLRILLRKHGIPFWDDGKYLVWVEKYKEK